MAASRAGRFVSSDPVVGSAGDPQSWNPYTYVRSNPLGSVDPSGLSSIMSTCSATCQAWRDLDARGIHSQDDLDRYQREQDQARNWVNSNSIANGGAGDCDTGC